jgi:hypothetical protein
MEQGKKELPIHLEVIAEWKAAFKKRWRYHLAVSVFTIAFYKLGICIQDFFGNRQGASWATPKFVINHLLFHTFKTGNSGRSPIYPYISQPYWKDFQAVVANNRYEKMLELEIKCYYKVLFFQGHLHPQRELNDNVIYNAEYLLDIQKRIEEQRHQTALVCVALGIYKDTYEAKQGIRGKWVGLMTLCIDKMIRASDYKYKHLLYRE